MRTKLLLFPGTTFASHRVPIAEAALEAGYEVHVAAPENAPVSSLDDPHLHHHAIGLARAPRGTRREVGAAVDVMGLLRRVRPDLVHLFTPRVIASVGPIVRMRKGPAIVSTITGLGYTFLYDGATASALRWGVSQAFRFTFASPRAHVIVQNHDDEHELTVRRVLQPERTTMIAGSGVDLEEFTPPAQRTSSPPLVVCACRLLWDKGVGEFVDAARQLTKRGIKARFALVGTPDLANPRHVPQASLERWREAGTVELWGQREDMPEVLRQADVFCLPSYREGMPRVLLEAAASGCALITTDAPGCRDFVDHDVSGLLVPPRDTEALATAMHELITQRSRRVALGKAARERVNDGFASQAVAQQVLGVYDRALDRD